MKIYEKSAHHLQCATVSMARAQAEDVLIITGKNPGFEGKSQGDSFVAPLTHNNAVLLRGLFPFTVPQPILTNPRTIGVGDRLGIATPGQLRAIARYDVVPVLAQQSIRELALTNRTFEAVLDAASFAVFREDFQRGFGADGDHLKTEDKVKYALSCGYSMITLDCSEHIRNDVADMADAEVDATYCPDPVLEELYCGKTFSIEGHDIVFSQMEFRRTCLIYCAAIEYAEHIYKDNIAGKPVDFEVSIDETMMPTTPAQHYFVAGELIRRGVKLVTIAPRFCGEFQKGIDYIGDIKQFETEMEVHAAIARNFGYKLSIHSGSDKFSVFSIIGRLTEGNFHVKTAGTSWLEAARVIAMDEPALFREMHTLALNAFQSASQFYHVTTNLAKIPQLSSLSDAELPKLLDNNDARQLIHITYGNILQAKAADGRPMLRDRLYAAWRAHDEQYAERLDKHIGRHLELLYSEISK